VKVLNKINWGGGRVFETPNSECEAARQFFGSMKSYSVILNCEYTELPSFVNFPCAADGVLINETYRVKFFFSYDYFFCDHIGTLVCTKVCNQCQFV
jgi:hypothetical protein